MSTRPRRRTAGPRPAPGPPSRRRFLALAGAAVGAACVSGGDESAQGAAGGRAGRRERIDYGDHEYAFGDLWRPTDAPGPAPVVVLIHGGFWRQRFGLDLMDGLAGSLAREGYAAWNIEYRRVGGGGGHPETFDDAAAAVDHVATFDDGVDTARVAFVGHSAGGQLAAWAASRGSLPATSPWSDPAVVPSVAVPQAGVLDLVRCAEEGVGGSSCPDVVGGGPDEVPDRYDALSPIELLPAGLPVVAVHGDADRNVPPTQSEAYVDAATAAGDPAELRVIAGADHFDMIDPLHEAWNEVLEVLATRL
ncbi:MAG: alpha/beta fold hydrolase [Acidimicrobiales bacterium]|nr:alpha/beta fold hydrolase [Acidimicrobiales bacterium]